MMDYSISFDYFYLPKNNEKELELTEHLLNYYNISNPDNFSLIHATSSRATHPLRRSEKKMKYLLKKTVIYLKIFFFIEI